MPSSTTGSVKSAMRQRLLASRAGMEQPARDTASARIRALVMTLPEVTRARVMLAFAATPAEVDLDPLLRERTAAGVDVLLPWVDGATLHVAVVGDLERDLRPGWRGVREPRGNARQAVATARIDVALVPGLGFDRRGQRLGYGGGHFDRLLARLEPGTPLVGVAYACQLVEELPAEAHDVGVDMVVTEAGVLRPDRCPGAPPAARHTGRVAGPEDRRAPGSAGAPGS